MNTEALMVTEAIMVTKAHTETKTGAGQFWSPVIQAYLSDKTALPPYMGLSPGDFSRTCHIFHISPPAEFSHQHPQRQLLAELAELRQTERQDLVALLNQYRNQQEPLSALMTTVLSFACLGTQHLWRDLGMPERPKLTQLFGFYYPQLQARNDKNMRWKRFLYRQLCSSGGDYVCRSPSCDTCTSFAECFEVEASPQ
ncbi:NifQ [Vibrio aerogenes CECT 7868]|uniref:NifQ n=1 Tax=Vibrio aerogenes CECT 7868 TaxID=1216006 RepID=A0A1M5WWJ0_9VIBR|nr:nitrogen fixation protein NifQ [Vibrio aerogenes]SHH92016.1 NifQ [Vibrio aerogenes CECT 7868]